MPHQSAFALEKTARDLARSVGLFLIVDGQREEVLAGVGLLLTDHGHEDDGIAHAGDNRTAGLASNFAGLECDSLAAKLECF